MALDVVVDESWGTGEGGYIRLRMEVPTALSDLHGSPRARLYGRLRYRADRFLDQLISDASAAYPWEPMASSYEGEVHIVGGVITVAYENPDPILPHNEYPRLPHFPPPDGDLVRWSAKTVPYFGTEPLKPFLVARAISRRGLPDPRLWERDYRLTRSFNYRAPDFSYLILDTVREFMNGLI